MQDAGAAAIELNIYYLPGDPQTSGRDVEQRHIDVLERVKDAVTVPVAVKLSPYFSSTGEIALRLDEAGADALVLFNRFLQPDIDAEELAIASDGRALEPGRRRGCRGRGSRCCAAGCAPRSRRPAASKVPPTSRSYLLAGADVVMTASALLRHGPEHAACCSTACRTWMARKGFAAVDELRGMLAVPPEADQAAFERAGYVSAMRAANAGSSGRWWMSHSSG